MVAFAVSFLGQSPTVVCNSRAVLNQAYSAAQCGKWIESGVLLREAVRLYVAAECQYWGVKISKQKTWKTPRALLEALRAAGFADNFCYERIGEAIDIGNRAAHCQFCAPGEIEVAIAEMHFILDNSRYLVQPNAEGRLS